MWGGGNIDSFDFLPVARVATDSEINRVATAPPPPTAHILGSPSADGQDLQQACGGHLEGGAELGDAGLLQQLERLAQHGLCATQLGQHVEQAAGDGQGHVHRLVAHAEGEHRDQEEALLGL